MFNPSRDQARRFFFETWRKYLQRVPLSGLEGTALGVLLQHPEYHPMLAAPETYLDRDYPLEEGETNPFLHLGMHLAIEEQIAIDQPFGIKTHYQRILVRCGAAHDAQHLVMDCLAEIVWQAQRHHTAFDGDLYLDCLVRRTATGKR
jgi:hypothetical protein